MQQLTYSNQSCASTHTCSIPSLGVVLILLIGAISAGCTTERSSELTVLPFYSESSFTPVWFETANDVPDDFHSIPAFSLVSQEGIPITETALDGKIVVANFFFASCPGICPSTMGNMAQIQRQLLDEKDVILLSHSVAPDVDDVEKLKSFAEQTHVISEKWLLATGDRDVIYDLGKHAYFAEEDLGTRTLAEEENESIFVHTEQFFLLDQKRRIRGVYNGMNTTSVLQMIDDARLLLLE